jgi:hypothetical protein
MVAAGAVTAMKILLKTSNRNGKKQESRRFCRNRQLSIVNS